MNSVLYASRIGPGSLSPIVFILQFLSKFMENNLRITQDFRSEETKR